jgi:hypothetical protein
LTIITPIRRWMCPNCKQTAITREAEPHTRFHACAGLKGITAPFVEEGVKVQVTAMEREDYIGSEKAQTDDSGRPIMAVRTDYADGRNDTAVLAPTATGGT